MNFSSNSVYIFNLKLIINYMINLNFNPKKNDLKNFSRNNITKNQLTNKSIEIHTSPNKNNLIEFSSPNIKEIKKEIIGQIHITYIITIIKQ